MKRIWVILLAVTLVLVLAACGAPQPEATSGATQQESEPATTQDTESTATTQDVEPTAAVQDNSGGGTVINSVSNAVFTFAVTGINRYDLSDGSEAIIIDCAVTNNSDKEQVVSSLLCFSATDTSNNKLSSSLDAVMEVATRGVNLVTLDGDVAPGATLKGSLYFSAAKGTRVNSITFSPVLSESLTLQLGGI